jgi:hypothetical protein
VNIAIEEEQDEFVRNYAGEIALECAQLEKAVSLGLEEYDNSCRLIGKNWYSVGLESVDADKEKDTVNKRNILLRIIDGVINFIRMIGKKIAEWFQICKQAILKFFGKETVDPSQVAGRFNILVEGLTKEDIIALVERMSRENKALLAEVLDDSYWSVFSEMYNDYMKVKNLCDSVDKFSDNYQFFSEIKQKSDELKMLIHSNKIHERADETLKRFLSTEGNAKRIETVGEMFNISQIVHGIISSNLERLLKQVPNEDLENVEGDNVDLKRREIVKVVSDVLKLSGEIIMKIDHQMQAVATLYTSIVVHRSKKLVYIPM